MYLQKLYIQEKKKLKIASRWLWAGVSNSITQGPVLANKV